VAGIGQAGRGANMQAICLGIKMGEPLASKYFEGED